MGGKKARRFKFDDFMMWAGDGRAARRRNRGFEHDDDSDESSDDEDS